MSRSSSGSWSSEFTNFRTASEDYFATMGIPLKAGRLIEATDGPGSPPVLAVNEAFARRYFPGGKALGQRVRLALDGEPFREVVGVVGDVHHDSLGEAPFSEVYMPMGQFPVLRMLLSVRSTQDAAALAPSCASNCARWIRTCRSFRYAPWRTWWTRASGARG